MKNLKLGVIALAALGLGVLVSEGEAFKAMITHPFASGAYGLCVIGGFVLALLTGVLGVVRPPFTQQQGLVALVGFALPGIKLRAWELVVHLDHTVKDTKLLLFAIAVAGGVLVSVVAMAKSPP